MYSCICSKEKQMSACKQNNSKRKKGFEEKKLLFSVYTVVYFLTQSCEAMVEPNCTRPMRNAAKPKKWNAIFSCHGTGSIMVNRKVKATKC
jgi:hypothetical protein